MADEASPVAYHALSSTPHWTLKSQAEDSQGRWASGAVLSQRLLLATVVCPVVSNALHQNAVSAAAVVSTDQQQQDGANEKQSAAAKLKKIMLHGVNQVAICRWPS